MKRKIDVIALLIIIAGALNCGSIAIFNLNMVAWVFGGQTVIVSRIVYLIAAIAGLWCINLIVVQSRKRIPVSNEEPESAPKSDQWSLKDNPEGETVCSAFFSKGCVNEDTDSQDSQVVEK